MNVLDRRAAAPESIKGRQKIGCSRIETVGTGHKLGRVLGQRKDTPDNNKNGAGVGNRTHTGGPSGPRK